ncbi:DUF302 domain-containing protein [Permianibacter aggregans]|uniref:Uncharacterized protein (DUF302 family) n=1 Tax=Permianibacter aggregans TaxID=1510150 RepID=A0A4R6UQ70_9GAMM|nr:DUF302 domain-containing protein [Permianibacter aggregans]QGX40469.1 DUF302 domain-containing protein [Permianibacter aggregans]TDQ49390.1 uncharacterized protein (DUF302 family) [Permianibacter aggregans]
MRYVKTTTKSVEQATADLEAAVVRHQFGVLHVHNLKETMKKKGVEFDNECRILEVCNPHQAKKVLNEDMTINMALPCRISVWGEHGKTHIGMLLPTDLLKLFSDSSALADVAKEVENATKQMIEEAL